MSGSEPFTPPDGDKLLVVRVQRDGAASAVELGDRDILREPTRAAAPLDTLCLAFLPLESRLDSPATLVRWFNQDPRLAAVGLRRVSRTGEILASVSQAPELAVLMRRVLLGGASTGAWRSPGPPIGGFAHDRSLSVEVVHPWAWAVRTADWTRARFASPLSWEYAVQVFIDDLTRRGAEVFFVSDVSVRDIDVQADPWCHPRRDLAGLNGLFAYVRGRWGPGTARLFRWGFKPLFLGRMALELPARVLRPTRKDPRRLRARDLLHFLAAT